MNRYSLWVYITVAVAIVLGTLYTLPNFYGESPAIQVSSARSTVKVDTATLARVEDALQKVDIPYTGLFLDPVGVKVRFADADTQLKAQDIVNRALNADPKEPAYIVTPNLLPSSPTWLTAIRALPMNLGLDLRGGVHFLLEVDMKGALLKRLDAFTGDIRTAFRDKGIRHAGIAREGYSISVRFRDAETRERANGVLANALPDLTWVEAGDDKELRLIGTIHKEAEKRIQEAAIQQNISTLNKRVNELGVAEPVIQQQGTDRIVVQLPGVQDIGRAESILGRTATLEVRLVDEDAVRSGSRVNVDVFPEHSRDGIVSEIPVKRQVVLTGDRFIKADATFDEQQRPAVAVELDATGGRVMRDVTRENLKRRMAIILFEKGKGEAISVATIQSEFGSRFQITGAFTTEETNNLAILIRAGALAAPMEIVEKRIVGPSLGRDNIEKGFKSTVWGFVAIAGFMIVYYTIFGLFSAIALAINVVLLIALLSPTQLTLTLPGIAAIALALGMAIDANVLINERIREELRNGATPQAAIHAGYDRAFGTIVDSNVTTFIVGAMLFLLGSGPVRGFAVVHCLGILTSIFSAVVVSRCLVNLYYGTRRRLEKIAIGNTAWK